MKWTVGVKGEAYSVPGGQGVGLWGPEESRSSPTWSKGVKSRPKGSQGPTVGLKDPGSQRVGPQDPRGSRGGPTRSQAVKGASSGSRGMC